MKPIYSHSYRITSKCNFSGRVTTFESIFKNGTEITKFMKQIDATLIDAEVIEKAACVGFGGR